MALSRVKVWSQGDVLTANDLNSEFNNILNNALSLISPLTGTLNAGTNQITNLVLENLAASPTVASSMAGRIWWNTAVPEIEVTDGTSVYKIPTFANPTVGQFLTVGSTGNYTFGSPASGNTSNTFVPFL